MSVELTTGDEVPVGQAHVSTRRGMISTTFVYGADYLQRRHAYPLGPDLPLVASAIHVTGLPGAFADAAPDRWGRNLILKRLRATDTGLRAVDELTFLLEVSDVTRQGALRFRQAPDGPPLAPHAEVPPLMSLPRLLRASDQVVAGGDDLAAVKELLQAGTGSLGGARPKASVRDGDSLLIVKFPHPHDDWDVMRWEATALTLARRAGIETPPMRLETVDGRGVLVLTRFDRRGPRRVGYLSAMSLLGARDGEPRDYVEIAEALAESAENAAADLRQLWRRVVLNAAIRNTDDHLRNHGFLRERDGWTLAPAFDLNPNPSPGASRMTGISGAWETGDEVDGLMAAAPTFRLSQAEARRSIAEVLDIVRGWRAVALSFGIPQGELQRFAPVLDDAQDRLQAIAG